MSNLFKSILPFVGIFLITLSHAQNYPEKPIKIIIGFAAGGPTDVIARVLAQDMTGTLGQSVIVENKAGANAKIATEFVAQATPDGYTLLFASLSHNVNAIMLKKPGYEPIGSFEPSILKVINPEFCSQGQIRTDITPRIGNNCPNWGLDRKSVV